jgi:probable rRNA maturation factor
VIFRIRHAADAPAGEDRNVRVVADYPAHVWLSPFSLRELLLALRAMSRALARGSPAIPLSVDAHLVDDASIYAANRQFMGCAGPTNVLSFPGGDGMRGGLLLSLDTFWRECLLYGQAPDVHMLWLLAHGMGHLAGFDHGAAMDSACEACFAAARGALALQ